MAYLVEDDAGLHTKAFLIRFQAANVKSLRIIFSGSCLYSGSIMEDEKQSSPIWRMISSSILGRAINRLAGPFVDAQVLTAFQDYFPKARLIKHARADLIHVETRLSHVSRKFVHVCFSVVLKDPQLEELCKGMELGGYKMLIFGFTSFKALWFPPSNDFYILDAEEWKSYCNCLEDTELYVVLRPSSDPVPPVD